jgi:hypothetical protein
MRIDRSIQELASPFMRPDGASIHEVVVDALARILVETDGALMLIEDEDAVRYRWLEPQLRSVFEEINSVMFRLTE